MGDPVLVAVQSPAKKLMTRKPRRTRYESDCSSFLRRSRQWRFGPGVLASMRMVLISMVIMTKPLRFALVWLCMFRGT